ncbi:glycosyltransferase family 2 protein [candidate division KSB1 bacterium]|nr:glycosyltransferase family 2 protein [candidate division KSB1 bacterium]
MSKDIVKAVTEISVVIPLYNEQESLRELHDKIASVMQNRNYSYEIIFIDDGSTDNSVSVIEELTGKNNRVKLLQFRKNYGKSAALAAGFEFACGRYVVTMDADLQDDPGEIPNLVDRLNEGYDLVSGWKKVRHDPVIKRLTSKIYNFFTSVFSGIRLHDFNCGLKAYRLDVVKSMHVYGEMHRYLPVLAHNNGFRVTEIPVRHYERKHGKSKFGAARFARGAFDLMTVTFLTKYKKRPLHLFGLFGVLTFLTGFVISLILVYQRLFLHQYLSNRPLLFLGVLLIIVGLQFFSIGLIGEMIISVGHENATYLIKRTEGWDKE